MPLINLDPVNFFGNIPFDATSNVCLLYVCHLLIVRNGRTRMQSLQFLQRHCCERRCVCSLVGGLLVAFLLFMNTLPKWWNKSKEKKVCKMECKVCMFKVRNFLNVVASCRVWKLSPLSVVFLNRLRVHGCDR